jgi:hypothetical protein
MADRSVATTALVADQAAKRILIERHQEEFLVILGDERVKRNLPRERGPDKRTIIMKKLEEQQRKLDDLRLQLDSLT